MISVVPTKEEKSRLLSAANKVLLEIEKETKEIDKRIRPVLLGSASRDTWLPNERDLDVFLIFPLEYEKARMEEVVTGIGRKILTGVTKRYAEHPYVRGVYGGFEVEIVPCYAVASPRDLKSAVDRTPFHDKFVKGRILGKENEVRLLKRFLKGIGCYGAEAKVEGLSGYLCELLIIKHGSFEGVLKAACEWHVGHIIWIGNLKRKKDKKFTEPLVFIDPVDENRNVSSALSNTKLNEFIFAAKKYLEGPRDEFFFPKKRVAEKSEIIRKFEKRKTCIVAVVIKTPDLVDDVLYPQLKRAVGTIKKLLLRSDFPVIGIDFFVGDKTCILIELASIEIPPLRLHKGPEVNTPHETRFLKKYLKFDGKLTEPFIMGDRWAIFLKRRYTNARALLYDFLSQEHLEKEGMPKYIANSLSEGHIISEGISAILPDFSENLMAYFDPRFRWESS
ncbi:MAG: CCA tRNA nucleotidyltransferase [Candidatus Hydrothermarchaeaceae archaeon]